MIYRWFKTAFMLTVSMWMLSASLQVEASRSPEYIKGSTRVTAEEFINLVREIPNLIVIDSRIAGDRKQGYVEGSLSLPDVDTTCVSLATKIPTHNSKIRFCCISNFPKGQ